MISHFEPPPINWQIRVSKSPWEVRIHQNPTRKEARDSRGTYAMRRSNSGDLWCHSLNSAGPNDDFLFAVPGTKSISDTYVPGDVQHTTASWTNARPGIRKRWTLKRDSPPLPPFLVVDPIMLVPYIANIPYSSYGPMTNIPLSCNIYA